MNGPRHQAREAALQILYFWEIGRSEPGQAIGAYDRHRDVVADAADRGHRKALQWLGSTPYTHVTTPLSLKE